MSDQNAVTPPVGATGSEVVSRDLFGDLTRRDWSTIRAALWAAQCSESGSRRGLNPFLGQNERIIADSVRRSRSILRVLKKCKRINSPNTQ